MSSINKIEYYQVYTGETRSIPLRTVNIDGTPFSLAGATEIVARFKKADGGVLIRSSIAVAEVSSFTFSNSNTGSFYDVIGAGKAIQLYNSPNIGHYFWFRVTDGVNTQTDPALVGNMHQVNILLADTAAQIATKFFNAVAALSTAFTATNATAGNVIVTCFTKGAVSTLASVTQLAAAVNLVTKGIDAGVIVTNDILGRLTVTLRSEDSSLLLVGERQSFGLVITLPYGTRKVNYRNALTVERGTP